MYLIKVEVKDSVIEGKGVFSIEDIKNGDVVWKFDPSHDKVLSTSEFNELDYATQESFLRVAYLSRITNRWVYPPRGDPAEFTNHSRENNLSALYKESISEEPFFFANRDISPGEELTNNYTEFDDLTSRDVADKWL